MAKGLLDYSLKIMIWLMMMMMMMSMTMTYSLGLSLNSYLRPGLEPPVVQKASFDEFTYDVDVSRNVAAKTRTCDNKDNNKLNVGAEDPNRNMYRSMPVSILLLRIVENKVCIQYGFVT